LSTRITSQTQTTMSRKLCVATFVAAFIVVAFTADVAVEARKMLQSDDDGRLDESLLPVVNVEENGDDVKAVGGIENGVNAQSPSWQAPGGGEGGGQAPESWRDPNLMPPPAQQAPESWRDPNLMPPPAQQAPSERSTGGDGQERGTYVLPDGSRVAWQRWGGNNQGGGVSMISTTGGDNNNFRGGGIMTGSWYGFPNQQQWMGSGGQLPPASWRSTSWRSTLPAEDASADASADATRSDDGGGGGAGDEDEFRSVGPSGVGVGGGLPPPQYYYGGGAPYYGGGGYPWWGYMPPLSAMQPYNPAVAMLQGMVG